MGCAELTRVGAMAIARGALAGGAKPMVALDENAISATGVAELEALLCDRLVEMDMNDEDGGDDDEGDGEEKQSGAVDMLAAALAGMGV